MITFLPVKCVIYQLSVFVQYLWMEEELRQQPQQQPHLDLVRTPTDPTNLLSEKSRRHSSMSHRTVILSI